MSRRRGRDGRRRPCGLPLVLVLLFPEGQLEALTHEDLHAAGNEGREAEQGQHGSPGGLHALLEPAAHLLAVHADGLGEGGPGQAAGLLQPAEAVRYAPVGPSEVRMALRRLRPKRKGRERTGGRMPFRPHRWFGKPRRTDKDNINGNGNGDGSRKSRQSKPPKSFLAIAAAVALAAAVAVPQAALADDHEPWRDEIDFEVTEPVEGRRLFVEGLTVSGDRAAVTLRAATALDIRVRAFGGPEGTWLRFWGSASLDDGERIDYSLPLDGPKPSFTFSWEDTLGQAGAVTVEGGQIPYPLPAIDGELCDLRVVSLGWSPGAVEGAVASECVSRTLEPIELQTVAGHASVTETALMDAEVTGIAGTLSAATGASQTSEPFVPNGETRFRLDVPAGQAIHAVSVEVSLEASLSIPMPPLTRLTHHPERVEHVTKTVHLHRPGDSDSDSETATAACEDGATASATATAYAYVPSVTIAREVTVTIVHPEHVKPETVERSPISRSRDEALALASGVGADDPYETLVLPEPEPVDPPAEQTPADGLSDWFRILGWEWPW